MSKKSILNKNFTKLYSQLLNTVMGQNVMNEQYKKEDIDAGMLLGVVKEFTKKESPVKQKTAVPDRAID